MGRRAPACRSAFPTAVGKARLVAGAAARAAAPIAAFPLRLNTGRYRDQWHTMTRTGLSATLVAAPARTAAARCIPDDAGRARAADGGLARVADAQRRSDLSACC